MKNLFHFCVFLCLASLVGCGTVGYPYTVTPPEPVITLCSQQWIFLEQATPSAGCNVQLTSDIPYQAGEAIWPDLIPGTDWTLSFRATISHTSPVPADGFAVVLGDPTLGATTESLGTLGAGLSARGIPGIVFAFDDYHNPDEPVTPYLGITQGAIKQWEKPWLFTNTNIPALAKYGATISHDYVFTMKQGELTITLDGQQIYNGVLPVPRQAYLYITSATGNKYEQVDIDELTLSYGSLATGLS